MSSPHRTTDTVEVRKLSNLSKLNRGLGFALFGIVALTGFIYWAAASEVTSRTDTLSNQGLSQPASHQVQFTLLGGNTFAAGESVEIDFHEDEGRFVIDGASAAIADFLVNDGTARTIFSVTNGSADCTASIGVNDIAVGINDTTGVVTFTACPSYTSSAAGAIITITIGSDAGGADRITNPSAAGFYVIDITDAAGDCTGSNDICDMAVSIIDAGNVSVTATVTAVCGNTVIESGEQCDDGNAVSGDGCSSTCQNEGGGPPPDTTPPVISNVTVSSIMKNSATVTWDTNESSSSVVNYGLTATYGDQVSNTSLLLNHSMSLSSLSEATTYHYQVCSSDGSNNQSCSSDATFVTLDETPPVISNVQVTSITETGATITWDTDESSDSNVDYNDTISGPPYGNTTSDATMVTSHSIVLLGLTASTTYHYRVRSVDSSLNEKFTTDTTFTTASPPDSTPPVISNVQVTSITETGATITWDTDESSDSNVDYNDTISGPPYGNTTSDATMVTSHSIVLLGLTTDTLYHFSVRSADAATNEASSTDATFMTLPPPDTTPPVISDVVVSAITGTGATITWTTDEQATQFVDYDIDGTPYDSTAGSATPLQTSHSVVLTGLTSETLYHYSVRSADDVSNEASTTDATFTTSDITSPVISSLTAVSIGIDTATITWTTNEPADSSVDYDNETGEPYASTSSDATMVTSHSIVLAGLTASTTYYYRARSSDASTNEATSTELTFTTSAPPDTTPPVISNVQVSGLTATTATIIWETDEDADSKVDYGLTTGYGSTESDATDSTSHTIMLTGLSENTTYHYRVRSEDAAANEASSEDATFKTIDATAPAISNVTVSGITETEVTITWDTNELADSHVDFDLVAGPPYGIEESDAADVTSHSITLTGLAAKTSYHFRVRSLDPEDNESASGDSIFTTVDTTAPVISNIQVTGLTDTGATITWDTDELADSTVEYGLTDSYGTTEFDVTAIQSHSISITGLDPIVEYHFRVKSKDTDDNESVSADQVFTTTAPPAPVISDIQVTAVTQTSVTITWDTDIDADSKVDFGLTDSYGNTRADATEVTSHSILIDNLVKNTIYHFRVRSKDQYGQEVTSTDDMFATAADTTPPDNATGFTATPGVNSVSLSWTNPTDPDFDGVWVVRREGGQPTDKDDGTWIYIDTGTSYTDVGLDNETTYYYGIFSFDGVPNYSSGAFASATPTGPQDFTPPPNVDPFTASVGDQQVQLTWTNPTDPDFAAVRIMRKMSGYPVDKDDGLFVYDGNLESKLDTGLTNGITYYYRAFSYDGALNYSAGADATATPVAPPDVTSPGAVTAFLADAGDTDIQLTWTNPPDVDFAGVRVLRKTGFAPTFNTDGTIIYEGLLNSRLDTGLTNDTEYFYSAFTFDTSSNWSGSVSTSAIPKSGEVAAPPLCTDSDGGLNYVLQGTVTEGESAFQDTCASSSSLIENYCFESASAVEIYDCGEGFKCSAGRCTADTNIADTEVCGNSICAGAENSLSCPIDCPVESTEAEVEVEEPTVEEEERLVPGDIRFIVSAGKVDIEIVEDNKIFTFPRMKIRVYLPDGSIRKPIRNASLNYRGASYPLRTTASMETSILTPSEIGTYDFAAIVNYEDDTTDTLSYVMDVREFGIVYEIIDRERVPVSEARVTLLKDTGEGNFGVVSTEEFGQLNPQLTDENGTYGYIVSPGVYKLKAEKEGYRTKEKIRFPLVGNLIQIDMQLIFIPPPAVEEITEILETDAPVTEKVVAVAGVAVDQVAYATKAVTEDVTEVIDNPFVEETTEDVAAPAVVAVALVNVTSAGAATATAIPYMMYLYSFLAHPTLLIARRRRKKWGIVFNAITKMPIDLAIVRLVDAETGRIIRSVVTDKSGRYFFIAPEGEYRMQVKKNGFVFPTEYMAGEKQGTKYTDLYHGEMISVSKGGTITTNIPVDPVESTETPRKIVLAGIGRRFQKSVGILSIAGMVIATIITPTSLVLAMLTGNIIMYLVFRRLSLGKIPKNWGIVYDMKTGKPIRNAVARIFESKYNKLLETQVTDARGRYAFLVGSNVFYVTFEKPGYRKQQTAQIDLKEIKEEGDQFVAQDVKLERTGKGEIKEDRPEEKKPSLLVGGTTDAKTEEKKVAKPSLLFSAEDVKKAQEEKRGNKEEKKDDQGTPSDGGIRGTEKLVETKGGGGGETPWELEMLKGLEGGGEAEQGESETKSEKEKELDLMRKDMAELDDEQLLVQSAVGAIEETGTESETPTPSDETPWELEMLKGLEDAGDGGEAGGESKEAPPSPDLKEILEEGPKEQDTPKEETKSDDSSVAGAAGSIEDQKRIQDVESAHPETKMIEDAEHAHPDEDESERNSEEDDGEVKKSAP